MDTPITLSLLIPIYNEEDNIETLLNSLLAIEWGLAVEFLFVDDHSKDGSLSRLKFWVNRHKEDLERNKIKVTIVAHPENRGKGAAIHTSIAKAEGEILIVQDADFEYDPREISKLIQPILENKADVVYGSRFQSHYGQTHRTYHFLVNVLLTAMSNLFSGLYLTDMETCYKAFRKEILKNIVLRSNRFGFEPEVTAHLARLKARVWELPITYFPRSYMEGKKITWKDGVAAFWHILYFNWLIPYSKRFQPTLPEKYVFKKWHEKYTGVSSRRPSQLESGLIPKEEPRS